jgi:TIR domain
LWRRWAIVAGIDVFISYRREEAGEAGRLEEWLAVPFGPERIFRDVTRLGGGDEFAAVISEAIASSTVVVAVVAPGWETGLEDPDDWVRRELREALAAGRPIVPVLFGGAPPPERSRLPSDIAAVAGREAIPVSDGSYRSDVGRVVEALERAGVAKADAVAFPEIPKRARAEARTMWYAADDPEHARRLLVAALGTNGIEVSGEEDETLLLKGGSKWGSQLRGLLFVREHKLPLLGRLRIRDRGAAVSIEVLLEEDVAGAFTGLAGRYSSRFDSVLADLRRATDRR